MRRVLSVVVLLLIAATPALSEQIRVPGRVMESDKLGASGAMVAPLWKSSDGGKTYSSLGGITTATNGEFTAFVQLQNGRSALLAYDRDRAKGALVDLDVSDHHREVDLMLQPLVEVSGTVVCSSRDEAPEWTRVFVMRGSVPIVEVSAPDGSYVLKLPPGRYKLYVHAEGTQSYERFIRIDAESEPMELSPIDLPPSILSRLRGHAAPYFTVTDARGVAPDVQPADYRGKWLLVAFWSHGVPACTRESLPALMGFAEEHAAARELFEIITVHRDPAVKAIAQLETLMKPLEGGPWKGRRLPFPILIDVNDGLGQRYGIQTVPTAILIDPEGLVVASGTEVRSELARRLSEFDPRVAEIAKALPGERDPKIALKMIDELAERGGSSALKALEAYAGTCPRDRVGSVLEAIGRIGGDEAAAFLCGQSGLKSPNASRVLLAVKALGSGSSPAAIAPLLELVTKKTTAEDVRVAAMHAVARAGPTDERSIEAILTLSRSRTTPIRAAAAEALGWLASDEAFERLLRLLDKDGSVKVRAAAATGLGHSSRPRTEVIALLREAAENGRGKTVRDAAAAALEALESAEPPEEEEE